MPAVHREEEQRALCYYGGNLINRYIAAEWYLFKSAIETKEQSVCLTCLDIINVLKKKFGSGLPLMLTATETALQAIVFKQKYGNETDDDEHRLNEMSSRFTFSFALSRFIGIVFELSKKGNLQSVTNSLKSIGIPRWVVRARNEAAHGHLPPAPIVNKALDFCLSWFNDVCWAGGPESCLAVRKATSQRKVAIYTSVLNRYMLRRRQLRLSRVTPSARLVRRTNVDEKKLRRWILRDSDRLFRSLFTVLFKSECEMGGGKRFKAAYLLKLWKPILLYICDAALLPTFFWTMANCSAEDTSKAAAVGAADPAAGDASVRKRADGERALQFLLKLVDDEDFSSLTYWDDVFQSLLSAGPCENKKLLMRVAERCQRSSEKKEIVNRLEDMLYSSTSSASFHPEMKAQTMGEEGTKECQLLEEFVNRELPLYTISDDCYDWSTVPIGTSPWDNGSMTRLRFADEMINERAVVRAAESNPKMELAEQAVVDADETVQEDVEADRSNLDEYGCYRRPDEIDVEAIARRVLSSMR